MAFMASTSSSCPERITTGTPGAFSRILRKVSLPWLSGRFRSRSTTAGGMFSMEASPSERRFTQLTSTWFLPSVRRNRTRSASPGLSSISKTCLGKSAMVLLIRKAGKTKPEIFNGAYCREKLPQISGLADVRIRAELIAAGNVARCMRSGEDHHRQIVQLGISFYLRQYGTPVFAGQVQVEDDEVGPTSFGKLT